MKTISPLERRLETLLMSLPEGTPGSRSTYTVDITAREKEACERFSKGNYLPDDPALVDDVLRKIALLPKIVVDATPPPDQ